MASSSEPRTSDRKNKKPGKLKKQNTNVDLTPMVDLGFLLITFFMFATTLAQPMAVKFRMPADIPGNPTNMDKNKALVLIADRAGSYFGYEPIQEKKIMLKKLRSLTELRNYIQAKKEKINGGSTHRNESVNIVLKIHPEANYKNLIDFLDEMTINNIAFYILDKIKTEETAALKDYMP